MPPTVLEVRWGNLFLCSSMRHPFLQINSKAAKCIERETNSGADKYSPHTCMKLSYSYASVFFQI